MRLDPIAADAGVRLLALGTIRSTNEEARRHARHETGPLWITAVAQTAGRGRMDRSWVSPQGNLYASLLLGDPAPIERAPELAFVAALALRDAVIAEAPALAPKLAFKWPNDLLLADAKCAGILIEGDVRSGGGERYRDFSVVIGIGVNCTSHPQTAGPAEGSESFSAVPNEQVSYPATDLRAHGADITPQMLFRRLSATMCRRIAQWNRGEGFQVILGDWLGAARGIGETIAVNDFGRVREGHFAGLDPFGRLVLELPGGGTEKIAAGDVFRFAVSGGPVLRSRLVE